VRLKGRRFHANAALVAVRVILSSADPTNAALVAVKLALVFVVQKNTDGTPIGAEHGATAIVITHLMRLLYQVAAHTLDGLDGMPVHRMRLPNVWFLFIVELVVTKSAGHVVPTAGGQEGGFSSVMGTALIGDGCQCVGHDSNYTEGLYARMP